MLNSVSSGNLDKGEPLTFTEQTNKQKTWTDTQELMNEKIRCTKYEGK